jgi:hypothetical protein
VQCASGSITVNGVALSEGDGIAASQESSIELRGNGDGSGELLLFDLA